MTHCRLARFREDQPVTSDDLQRFCR